MTLLQISYGTVGLKLRCNASFNQSYKPDCDTFPGDCLLVGFTLFIQCLRFRSCFNIFITRMFFLVSRSLNLTALASNVILRFSVIYPKQLFNFWFSFKSINFSSISVRTFPEDILFRALAFYLANLMLFCGFQGDLWRVQRKPDWQSKAFMAFTF